MVRLIGFLLASLAALAASSSAAADVGQFDDWIASMCRVSQFFRVEPSGGLMKRAESVGYCLGSKKKQIDIGVYSSAAALDDDAVYWHGYLATLTDDADRTWAFFEWSFDPRTGKPLPNEANFGQLAPLEDFGFKLQRIGLPSPDQSGAEPPNRVPDGDIGPDLPGQHMNVVETHPCDNWERWTFGRSPSGEFMACVSFDGGKTGMWSKSAPVAGIREIAAPCSQANGDNLAQAPDGRPLLCDGVWLALPYGNLG